MAAGGEGAMFLRNGSESIRIFELIVFRHQLSPQLCGAENHHDKECVGAPEGGGTGEKRRIGRDPRGHGLLPSHVAMGKGNPELFALLPMGGRRYSRKGADVRVHEQVIQDLNTQGGGSGKKNKS